MGIPGVKGAKVEERYNQSMSLSSHTPCNYLEASRIHCEADIVSTSQPTSLASQSGIYLFYLHNVHQKLPQADIKRP